MIINENGNLKDYSNREFDVIKVTKDENEYDEIWYSVYVRDKKKKISFWLDFSPEEVDEEDGTTYYTWDFNKDIFYLTDKDDIRERDYQKDENNVQRLIDWVDYVGLGNSYDLEGLAE